MLDVYGLRAEGLRDPGVQEDIIVDLQVVIPEFVALCLLFELGHPGLGREVFSYQGNADAVGAVVLFDIRTWEKRLVKASELAEQRFLVELFFSDSEFLEEDDVREHLFYLSCDAFEALQEVVGCFLVALDVEAHHDFLLVAAEELRENADQHRVRHEEAEGLSDVLLQCPQVFEILVAELDVDLDAVVDAPVFDKARPEKCFDVLVAADGREQAVGSQRRAQFSRAALDGN